MEGSGDARRRAGSEGCWEAANVDDNAFSEAGDTGNEIGNWPLAGLELRVKLLFEALAKVMGDAELNSNLDVPVALLISS
jgi:hypothetical protein